MARLAWLAALLVVISSAAGCRCGGRCGWNPLAGLGSPCITPPATAQYSYTRPITASAPAYYAGATSGASGSPSDTGAPSTANSGWHTGTSTTLAATPASYSTPLAPWQGNLQVVSNTTARMTIPPDNMTQNRMVSQIRPTSGYLPNPGAASPSGSTTIASAVGAPGGANGSGRWGDGQAMAVSDASGVRAPSAFLPDGTWSQFSVGTTHRLPAPGLRSVQGQYQYSVPPGMVAYGSSLPGPVLYNQPPSANVPAPYNGGTAGSGWYDRNATMPAAGFNR